VAENAHEEGEAMPIHDWAWVFAGLFHSFHLSWVTEISRELNVCLLPSDHYALIERAAGMPEDWWDFPTASGGGHVTDAVVEEEIYARKTRSIVIRRESDERTIARIELLSPGHKSSPSSLRAFLNRGVDALTQGIHLLVIDLYPPGPHNPQRIHGALWSEIGKDNLALPSDKPLTVAAYSAGDVKCEYVETLGVGDVLPDMPLFLDPDHYNPVPLEATYRFAREAIPRRWRDVLEA